MWVYVLQSETTRRYYCGQTNDVERRLRQHNDPAHQKTKTTKRFEGPWNLVWSQICPNRTDALQLEKKIKKRGILRFLQEHMVGKNDTGGF